MRDVHVGRIEVLAFRIAVFKERVGFILDLAVQFRLRRHGIEREAVGVSKVHAGNQRGRKGETQVRLRDELGIARVQAQQVVSQITGTIGPLGGRVDTLDPFKQRLDGLPPAFHTRGLQHELGQDLQDMRHERPFFVLRQVIKEVLRLDTHKKR